MPLQCRHSALYIPKRRRGNSAVLDMERGGWPRHDPGRTATSLTCGTTLMYEPRNTCSWMRWTSTPSKLMTGSSGRGLAVEEQNRFAHEKCDRCFFGELLSHKQLSETGIVHSMFVTLIEYLPIAVSTCICRMLIAMRIDFRSVIPYQRGHIKKWTRGFIRCCKLYCPLASPMCIVNSVHIHPCNEVGSGDVWCRRHTECLHR